MFFLLWPLFARAPCHWFLENFLLSAPGVQSVFFVALRWAPRPFGGARAKKNTPPGCFLFCSGPGERQGKEKPRWARARAKKTPPRVFFFLLWPRRKAREGEAPLGAGTEPEQKKNTLGGVFFCSGPVPAPNGASPSLAFRRCRSKKNTLGGVFFFLLWPRAGTGLLLPLPFPGAGAKKTPWVVFFFAAAPRGRSLTHCGPGWRCLPLAGVVFFCFCCGPARTRVVFFFAVAPPGRSLTHCGLGRFRQGPGGVFFFAAAPPGLFRQ